ncbi:MAG: HAD family hydrolase [Gammaproteobacteria bacterium]
MIRCVTFDLDDTLWACGPVILRAEQALYDWLGEHYPRICAAYTIEDMRQQRAALLKSRADLRHDMTALRRHWIARLADEADYEPDMVEQAVAYFRHHRNQVTLFDAAEPLLRRLRQRYTVGAITNGNAQLEYIGVDGLFDFIVYSADVGAAKPDARVFHRALAQARAEPAAAVHVGDDPDKDMLGAARAGLRTVWYNPALMPWPGGKHPDAVIRSLPELDGVLARWAGSEHHADAIP